MKVDEAGLSNKTIRLEDIIKMREDGQLLRFVLDQEKRSTNGGNEFLQNIIRSVDQTIRNINGVDHILTDLKQRIKNTPDNELQSQLQTIIENYAEMKKTCQTALKAADDIEKIKSAKAAELARNKVLQLAV